MTPHLVRLADSPRSAAHLYTGGGQVLCHSAAFADGMARRYARHERLFEFPTPAPGLRRCFNCELALVLALDLFEQCMPDGGS